MDTNCPSESVTPLLMKTRPGRSMKVPWGSHFGEKCLEIPAFEQILLHCLVTNTTDIDMPPSSSPTCTLGLKVHLVCQEAAGMRGRGVRGGSRFAMTTHEQHSKHLHCSDKRYDLGPPRPSSTVTFTLNPLLSVIESLSIYVTASCVVTRDTLLTHHRNSGEKFIKYNEK